MDERPGMTPEGRRAVAWTFVVVIAFVILVVLLI
jgi:hypothetical protein